MDEEIQKPEPKLTEVEIVAFIIVFILCDILELIPLAGDILDIVVAPPFDLYLFFRGLNGIVALIDQIIEAIPALQEIPLWTATWLIIIYLDRHPKIAAVAEVAGSVTGSVSGAEDAAATAEKSGTIANEASKGNVITMTETEPGNWEYQPEGEARQGGAKEISGNERASEKTTERDAETASEGKPSEHEAMEAEREEERKIRRSENEQGGEEERKEGEPGGETEEERQQKLQKDKDYDEMMMSDAEKDPTELVKRELFSENGPQQQKSPKVESIDDARARANANQNANTKEAEAKRRLEERYAREQKKLGEFKKLEKPQVTEEENKEDDYAKAA